EMEIQKRNAEKDAVEATKSDIGWGSQDRNYVLDQSRIKDLRTGIERTDTHRVLDGDLDEFVEATLKAALQAGATGGDAASTNGGGDAPPRHQLPRMAYR